jgi:hypothetical protein
MKNKDGFSLSIFESLLFTPWREGGSFSPWTGMPLLSQAIFRYLITLEDGRDQISQYPANLTMIHFFQEIF